MDYLDDATQNEFLAWWGKYSASTHLVNSWDTNVEEGKLPFKGLLDKNKYLDGPQLCYPPGTDVRN